MSTRPKYIVLVSMDIGGAEKRFVDIFKSLRIKDKNVFLVISAKLFNKVGFDNENNIIVIGNDKDTLTNFVVSYSKWLQSLQKTRASFHYPMNCLFFLHWFKPHSVSMSLTNCYFAPSIKTLNRSRIRQFVSLFFVSKVDILNPTIFDIVSSFKTIRSSKLFLTPNGTYVYPQNISLKKTKPSYGYIGRLIEGKGIENLLKILPEIWELIALKVSKDFIFFVAGYGPLETLVKEKIEHLKKLGVPIEFYGYVPADEILSEARLVFSLQEITNYPSRVVAEALLNGCSVLVTDSGDSRNFGNFDHGLKYITPELSSAEIAELILETEENYIKNPEFNSLVREAGIARFSSPKVIDYFHQILLP